MPSEPANALPATSRPPAADLPPAPSLPPSAFCLPPSSPTHRTALFSALAAAGILAISALFTPDALPKFDLCTFHRLTGLPCPSCGLTRAFCAISHGDFAAAWRFNPFGFLFYAGVLAVPAWAAWKWRNPHLTPSPRWQRAAWIGGLAIFLLMCAHNVWRVVCR